MKIPFAYNTYYVFTVMERNYGQLILLEKLLKHKHISVHKIIS